MRKGFVPFVTLVLLLCIARISHAAVKVVSERSADAGSAFKFKDVPTPSKTDLGNKGKFTVVAGRIDGNGGGVETLNDGRLPSEADQPAANFFFAANSDGGRILVDLGEVAEIKQVNTYSWHRAGRGPQVYKLYGHESSADTAKETDVEKSGWKLVASVDTRPKEGQPGGQYGVTIGDDAGGGAIGKF